MSLQELGAAKTISFPTRWTIGKLDQQQTATEIDRIAQVLVDGCEAISGTYLRLCDLVRNTDLPDWKIRQLLGKHFPQPRVSEIMRLARAPEDVYLKYKGGLFGFKMALKQCRYYNITPSEHLTKLKAKRAAERLIQLLGASAQIRVRDRLITIS